MGLRSRATRGKTGPSLKGVSPAQDGWLQALMSLLLEVHGEDLEAGQANTWESWFGGRCQHVKTALERYSKEGFGTGLKEEEIAVLRWHGVKAALSSIMQHLDLPKLES